MNNYADRPYRRENSYRQKNRKQNKNKRKTPLLLKIVFLLIAIGIAFAAARIIRKSYMPKYRMNQLEHARVPDYVEQNFLGYDSNSRSGEKLEAYNGIVIHYVANPGTSAQANYNYFASSESDVASHFIIGLDGEIIQCLPLDEKSAASNWRNTDTISIEVCHPDESGKFNEATYDSLVRLTKWLVKLGKFNPKKAVIRHYDITGKICPKYFVDNPDAWKQFLKDVAK